MANLSRHTNISSYTPHGQSFPTHKHLVEIFPDTQTFRPTQQWAITYAGPALRSCIVSAHGNTSSTSAGGCRAAACLPCGLALRPARMAAGARPTHRAGQSFPTHKHFVLHTVGHLPRERAGGRCGQPNSSAEWGAAGRRAVPAFRNLSRPCLAAAACRAVLRDVPPAERRHGSCSRRMTFPAGVRARHRR